MQLSRALLSFGFLGLLYAPAVSAQSQTDSATQYSSVWSGSVIRDMIVTNPDTTMTRATFTQMVVDHLYSQGEIDHCYWDIASTVPPTFTLLYTDVRTTAPYAKELCIAMRDGLARGYKDGSFHPDQRISFAEASKIISKAYVLAPYADVANTGPWFGPHALAISNRNAIPATVTTFQHIMTAGETRDMLERLSNGITWMPASNYADIERLSAPKKPVTPARLKSSVPTPRPTPVTMGYSSKAISSAAASIAPISSRAASKSSAAMMPQSSSQEAWYKFF